MRGASRLAFPLLFATLVACGERQQALGETGPPPGASASGAPAGTATAVAGGSARLSDRAAGELLAELVVSTNEPYWQARVQGDQLVVAGIETVRRLRVDSSMVESGMRVVRASDALGTVLLTARVQPCTDDMSGAPFSMSGTLQIGGQGPYRGCARALAPPPAPDRPSVDPRIPAVFHGHWAPDLAACATPGAGSEQLHVASHRLFFHERVAVPTKVQPVNATTLNLTLDYTGGGERWTSLQTLQLSGGDSLTIKGPGRTSMRRVRCAAAT